MVYRQQVRLPFPPAEVFAWYARPGAFERLAPPWSDVRVVSRRGTIRDGDEITFEISFGPARARWTARHRDYVEGERFVDEQASGPFRTWTHRHQFEPDGEGGTRVRDEVEYEGGPSSIAPNALATELDRVFGFRGERLAHDLAQHARWRDRPRLTVAVTGSSGLIGSALGPFLTAAGHRVIPLVRSREAATVDPATGERRAIHWNPDAGEIDAEALRGVDAVVHLAGEPIVQLPRWSDEKKKRILESRVKGTTLIAGALAGLRDGGPRTLVSMSGVGFYGDRGDEILTEDAGVGKGFLAEVVTAWEESTRRAKGAGLRVVNLRTGPVLTPAGGMLEKVLIPFRMGMGGRVGSGRQYVPWIDLDDMLGIVLHALMDDRLSGPVNACAPNPVPNAAFADALGRVLGRPTLVPAPALAVRMGLGEMGEETLLFSQRAKPARLLAAGYRFLFEGIEDSLRFELGR